MVHIDDLGFDLLEVNSFSMSHLVNAVALKGKLNKIF